jgi:hypothetical protein
MTKRALVSTRGTAAHKQYPVGKKQRRQRPVRLGEVRERMLSETWVKYRWLSDHRPDILWIFTPAGTAMRPRARREEPI